MENCCHSNHFPICIILIKDKKVCTSFCLFSLTDFDSTGYCGFTFKEKYCRIVRVIVTNYTTTFLVICSIYPSFTLISYYTKLLFEGQISHNGLRNGKKTVELIIHITLKSKINGVFYLFFFHV